MCDFFARVRSTDWYPLSGVTIRTFIAVYAQGLCLTDRDVELCIRFDTLGHPPNTSKMRYEEVNFRVIHVLEVNSSLRGSILHLRNDMAVL